MRPSSFRLSLPAILPWLVATPLVFGCGGEPRATQTASVAAAEEDLRAQQRRYERGESTLLDVLTSQAQLDQSRQALIRARYDRRIGLAQLESLVGHDLTHSNPAHP